MSLSRSRRVLVAGWDRRVVGMTCLSAAAHALLLAALVVVPSHRRPRPAPLVAYTVELVRPGARGGSLPPGAPAERLARRTPQLGGGPKAAAEAHPARQEKPEHEPKRAERRKAHAPSGVVQAKAGTKAHGQEKVGEKSKKKEKEATTKTAKGAKEKKPLPRKEAKTARLPTVSGKKKSRARSRKVPKKPNRPRRPAVGLRRAEKRQQPAAGAREAEKSERRAGTHAQRETAKQAARGAGRRRGGKASAAARARARRAEGADAYKAAMERFRRLASRRGGGGMGGERAATGPPSSGGRGPGGGGLVVGLEFLKYKSDVERIIKAHWVNPVLGSGLRVATVHFSIADDGAIGDVRLVRSSGNAIYDRSVLRAVREASPLPPPPDRYREEFRSYDLEFLSTEARKGEEPG